jgi:hypothetical protein
MYVEARNEGSLEETSHLLTTRSLPDFAQSRRMRSASCRIHAALQNFQPGPFDLISMRFQRSNIKRPFRGEVDFRIVGVHTCWL